MKKLTCLALVALLALFVNGCGLVSGTVFVSEEVDGSITTDTRDTTPLDASMAGVEVDLTENSDWQDIDIDGVEDGCIHVVAENHLDTPVSGEIWIVMDLDFDPMGDPDAVRNNPNAFRVFSGIALLGNETREFHCFDTIALLENTDLLQQAVANGTFQAWGLGDQDIYCFTLTGIIFGFHVTGSL